MNEFLKGDVYFYLKMMFDVKNENINLLPILPSSIMELYCFDNGINCQYFNSLEELKEFESSQRNVGLSFKIEYLGDVANKENVIKQSYKNGAYRLISYIDNHNYEVYNEEKSKYKGVFVWDHYFGNISDIYYAFDEYAVDKTESSIK